MLRSIAFTGLMVPLLLLTAAGRPFVGILLWSWVSFMSPHRMIWGFAQGQPWAMIIFAATLIGCLVAREPKRLPRDAVSVLLILFALGVTITSAVAIAPPELVWRRYDRVIKILAGVMLTRALLSDADRIHALLWMIAISLGFYGVKGGGFTLLTGGGHRVLGPIDSMIADRNHLAAALLVSLPIMNYLRLQSRHHIVRLAIGAVMVLTLFSVVGSQSRGALIGLAATGLMLWLRSRGKIISGVAIAVLGALAIGFMPDTWVERMRTIREFEGDGSAMGRLEIWEASLRIALARPLIGGGFQVMYVQSIVDMYAPGLRARAAHSIWFEPLGEHGFIVFGIWLGLMIAGWVYSTRLVRIGRRDPAVKWAFDLGRMSQVSIVAYASAGSLLSLSYWDVYLTLMATLGAAHELVACSATEPRAAAAWARPWRASPAVAREAAAAAQTRGGRTPQQPGRPLPGGAPSLAATSWRTRP